MTTASTEGDDGGRSEILRLAGLLALFLVPGAVAAVVLWHEVVNELLAGRPVQASAWTVAGVALLLAVTVAALELGGRRRGGRGLLGWIRKLPWGDPALSCQLLAMLVFLLGGITGLILASYNINQVVHNTTFVPGHFHMTVGTAVALSFMGPAGWPWPRGGCGSWACWCSPGG